MLTNDGVVFSVVHSLKTWSFKSVYLVGDIWSILSDSLSAPFLANHLLPLMPIAAWHIFNFVFDCKWEWVVSHEQKLPFSFDSLTLTHTAYWHHFTILFRYNHPEQFNNGNITIFETGSSRNRRLFAISFNCAITASAKIAHSTNPQKKPTREVPIRLLTEQL